MGKPELQEVAACGHEERVREAGAMHADDDRRPAEGANCVSERGAIEVLDFEPAGGGLPPPCRPEATRLTWTGPAQT